MRKDFKNQEELYKFTKDNPNIKVKGIYTEEKNGKQILVINYTNQAVDNVDKFVNYYYITDEDYEEAQKNGINKDRLQARVLRLGWSINRAKTQPIMKKKNITDEQLKIAKENGLDRRGILSRMSQSGMTLEEAISRPKRQ